MKFFASCDGIPEDNGVWGSLLTLVNGNALNTREGVNILDHCFSFNIEPRRNDTMTTADGEFIRLVPRPIEVNVKGWIRDDSPGIRGVSNFQIIIDEMFPSNNIPLDHVRQLDDAMDAIAGAIGIPESIMNHTKVKALTEDERVVAAVRKIMDAEDDLTTDEVQFEDLSVEMYLDGINKEKPVDLPASR